MSAAAPSARSLVLAVAAPLLCAGAALAFPQPMPGQTLLYPSAGVVCDQPAQRCYDSGGLSLSLTGQYFGAFAQQNALRDLGDRRPPRQFTLSDGSRCDLRRLVCWSTGMGQPVVNQQLTSQLFGGLPRPDPAPAPYPSPGPGGYTGQCRLLRDGNPVVQGPCALNEVRQGAQPRFEVVLQNGPRYVFEQGPGGYQISDGLGGRWPVQFNDNGSSGVFRWASMALYVTQNNYRPQSDPNARWGRAIGNFLIDLFN